MSVHAHIHMIEIMFKVGLIKECLKYLFKSHSMGLYFPLYGRSKILKFGFWLKEIGIFNSKF